MHQTILIFQRSASKAKESEVRNIQSQTRDLVHSFCRNLPKGYQETDTLTPSSILNMGILAQTDFPESGNKILCIFKTGTYFCKYKADWKENIHVMLSSVRLLRSQWLRFLRNRPPSMCFIQLRKTT